MLINVRQCAEQFGFLVITLVLVGCGKADQSLPAAQAQTTASISLPSETPVPPTHMAESASPMPTRTTATLFPPTPTYAAVAPVSPLFYSDPELVEKMRQQLLRTDLDPETRRGIEKALWMEDKDAIARATTQAKIADGSLVVPTPSGPPTPNPLAPTPPRGIFEGFGGPFSPSEFDVHNMWQDEIDGYWWVIYAGADGQDHTQGLLVAYKIIQRVPTETQGGRYTTPNKTGYLRITSVKNMLVSVVAQDGQTFVFDLTKRAWVP